MDDIFVAEITGDTIDDILFLGYTEWTTAQEKDDSTKLFLLLFDGQTLSKHLSGIVENDSVLEYGQRWYEDTIARIPPGRIATIGNFRGTGRKDLITTDSRGNFFFFKNDPPFSMQKFMDGIRMDTLSSVRDNPNWLQDQHIYYISRRALSVFPKTEWDNSEDFIGRFNTNDYRSQAWLFFRGGPEFGSHRITLDSAEFVLRSPSQLGAFGSLFSLGYYMADCGDMTGSGHRVIKTVGIVGHGAGEDLYYLTGKALDEKIDINISYSVSPSSPVIKVNANEDKLQDVLFTVDNYKPGNVSDRESVSLCLLKGSKDIPVTLNPKYAVEERKALSANNSNLLVTPNPFEQKTVITFDNCSSGKMYMEVVNTLGKVMLREEIVDVDGLQQYSADLSMLVPGAYHIRLVCPADGWSATATVVKM